MANISASTGPYYIYLDTDVNLTMSGASGNSVYEYNVNKTVKRGSSLVTNANVYKGMVYKDEDADRALVEKIGDRFLGNLEVPFPAVWEEGDGFKPHAGQYGIFTVDSPSEGRQKIFYAYAIKGKDVSYILNKYNYLSEPINGHACPEQKLPFTVVWDRNNTCDTSMLYPLEGAWVTLEGSATTHTVQMSSWSNANVWGYNIRQKPDSFYYSWTGTGTTLNITIPENNSKYERKYAVFASQTYSSFYCPSTTFYFFQKSNLFFNLITTATTVDEDGGWVYFYYETNISTFNPKDLLFKVNGFEWDAKSVTSGVTSIRFLPNPDNENKQGTVEFYLYMDGEEPDRLLATAYVTQLGQDEIEYFNTDTSLRYLSPSGGTETIYFNTNISVGDLSVNVDYDDGQGNLVVVSSGYTIYPDRLVLNYPENDSDEPYYWFVVFWRSHPRPMVYEKLAQIQLIQYPDSQPQPSYYFNLITTGATVPASGGTARIYYDTNIPLSKIEVSPSSYITNVVKNSGYTDITVGEYYNPNVTYRNFRVYFNYAEDGIDKEVLGYTVITQMSLTSFILLDKESVLPQIGGILDIRVSTDFGSNEITVGNSDWLTYGERTRSGKIITYRFAYLTYTGQTGRDGYVTFTTPIGDFTASVTQIGRYFSCEDVKQVPSNGTSRLSISYLTNVPLEDITVSASSSAITIISYSATTAYISVGPWEPTDGSNRTMYVTFKYEAIPGSGIMVERETKIVQLGGAAYILVVNSAVTTSADEHDVTIYYYSNIDPSGILIEKEGASEMIESFSVSEESDTMYDIVVHLNANTGETRTAALRLSSTYVSSAPYIYITQLVDEQYFNLVTTSLTLDWSGGTAVVEYDTNLPIDYVSAYTSYWADIVSQDATSVTIEYGAYNTSGYTRNGYVDLRTPLGEYEAALVQPGPDVPNFRFLTASERTFDSGTTAVTIEWETTYSAVSYSYRAVYRGDTLDITDVYYAETTSASSITFSPPINVWTEPQNYYFDFYLKEPFTQLGRQKITIMGVPEAPVWSSVTLYIRSSQNLAPNPNYYRTGAVRWEWEGLSRAVFITHSGITTLNGLPWWEFTYQLDENSLDEPVSTYNITVTNNEFEECTALGDYYCNKELRGANYVYTWERTPYHAEEVIIGEGITRLGNHMGSSVIDNFNPATYVLGGTDTYFFPNPYVIPSTAQYIELPRTLRTIEPYVFYQCATNEIHYRGTKDQWKGSVYLMPDWCYPAGQWTVICTDGNLEY